MQKTTKATKQIKKGHLLRNCCCVFSVTSGHECNKRVEVCKIHIAIPQAKLDFASSLFLTSTSTERHDSGGTNMCCADETTWMYAPIEILEFSSTRVHLYSSTGTSLTSLHALITLQPATPLSMEMALCFVFLFFMANMAILQYCKYAIRARGNIRNIVSYIPP